MSCSDVLNRLDDLVDGALNAEERTAVEAHVAGCADCRSELDSLNRLRRRTALLARSVEPTQDLWPGIADRIERTRIVRARFGATARRTVFAAAAAAVVVGAVLAAYIVGRQHAEPVVVQRHPTPNVVAADYEPTSLAVVEFEFHQARAELMAILDQRRETLSPETLRVVDSNLELIAEAIQEITAALGRDPDNPQLNHRLASAYRHQIQLLRRATALPSEI